MTKYWTVFCAVALIVACGHAGSPTGPSAVVSTATGIDPQVRAVWSPYVGVHPYGGAQSTQLPYLKQMLDAPDVVRGIRIDVDTPDSEAFARWASDHGVEDILAVFPNEHLRQADVWNILAEQIRRNPQIIHWEIGNEVQGFIKMPADEYMPIFTDLYLRAQKEFPEVVLIPQAIVGGGDGDQYFQGMLDRGLKELQPRVVAVHYYSDKGLFIERLAAQIHRLSPATEVWVTESGVNDWGRQTSFVKEQYPRMHSELRVTRIYWYDFSGCDQFSLVSGLPLECVAPPQYSPLFTALVGGQGVKP